MKIAWAMDLFPKDKNEYKAVASLLKQISESQTCEVQPVYVMNFSNFAEIYPTPHSGEDRSPQKAQSSAIKILKGTLADLAIRGLKEPEVLIYQSEAGVTRNDIERLNSYLELNGFDLVILFTHSRKGIERFLLGSFAESMVINSKIPILMVNPTTQIPQNLQRIVYPTDFSKTSNEGALKFLQSLQTRPLEITLFHQLIDRISPLVASGAHFLGGDMPNYNQWATSADEKAKKQLALTEQSLKNDPLSKEVKIKSVLDTEDKRVADAVIQYAQKEKLTMIALTSKCGTLYSTLVGSVTREIIRTSNLPVWVIPSHWESRKKKTDELQKLSQTLF